MATFIIMFQEIISNVDSFVFVFALVLVMFAFVYHILLKDNELGDDFEDDTVDHGVDLFQSAWNGIEGIQLQKLALSHSLY
jgi:hypothetical protein